MLIHLVSLLQCRIRVRVVTARAYHCLFMHNMLLRPSEAELASFGAPDFTIFNAGGFPANRYTSYMTSSSSVDINLKVNRFKHAQRTFQRFPESTSMFTAAVDCKGTTHEVACGVRYLKLPTRVLAHCPIIRCSLLHF